MVDFGNASKDRWVCPNDRQLALRANLFVRNVGSRPCQPRRNPFHFAKFVQKLGKCGKSPEHGSSRASSGSEYFTSTAKPSQNTITTSGSKCRNPHVISLKGSGEFEEESSSEDEVNKRRSQARIRQIEETETGGSRHSLGRQGSCVTFDPSLGPVPGSLPTQRSESLSLVSDGEIPIDVHSYTESDKLSHHPGSLQDYYRSRESLDSSVSFSRQASCNMSDMAHGRALDTSPSHLEQPSWDHRQSATLDMENNPSPYKDRASLSSSSVSGHRTASSCGADTTEDNIDAAVMENDDDKYGNDFIGEARIPLIHLKPQEPKHLNIYLEKHYPTYVRAILSSVGFL
ncbi:hypothetical protein C0J52_07925 [Blattella germanica]|nr:hypothetical protein C0J52_07925 [Blattella germanica]